MHVKRLNRPIFALPPDHIARRFLESFINCRRECVGREIVFNDSDIEPIEQEWFSVRDNKKWKLSSFAYTFISFDIVLDGWLSNAPALTVTEQATLPHVTHLVELMQECKAACKESSNEPALALVQKIMQTLDLWEQCILAREVQLPDE